MRAIVWCCAAVALAACGVGKPSNQNTGTTAQPELSGDACALFTTEQSCDADAKDGCHWVGTEAPCLVLADGGVDCPANGGACVGPGGGSTDGGIGGGCGTVPPPAPNPCSQLSDQKSCNADTGDHCYWFGEACPLYILPDGGTGGCTGGTCVQQGSGGGGCDGGSTGGGQAGCACAVPVQSGSTSDQYICVQQMGGPAMNVPPPITCEPIPQTCTPVNGDPCSCVQNEGRCTSSTAVVGLCICYNGIY